MPEHPDQSYSSYPDVTAPPSAADRPSYGYRSVDDGAPPSITVVTPYFNTGAIFEETVESVLRQTFQAWEWIIVDDGSTDASAAAYLSAVAQRDPRIRVVAHEGNRGPGAARNTGFANAGTEYVAQLDSDDLLEPTMLEKLYWFMESHPDFSFVKGYTVGFGAESYVWVNGFHLGEAFLENNRAGITAVVRRSVHQEVGGYDEANRDGLEDWEFWLNCASHGYWGGTVHEPMSWYRRRAAHGDQWANWDGGERESAFRSDLKRRYPGLWSGGFPRLDSGLAREYQPIPDAIATRNELVKDRPRILLIVPWLTVGGADRVNLDLVDHLTQQGWGVTIATTLDGDHSWEPEFARFTSDLFPMHRFLRPVDYPRFLRYLIGSRVPDVVLISNSELGYQLLPYLRAHCPEPTYVDLAHAEQDDWKSGGHPHFSVLAGDQLDATIVISEHLKEWMVERGADADRIVVCHLGVDERYWCPDDAARARTRRDLGVPDGTALVTFVGRLAQEKQPGVLAGTVRSLVRSGEDVVAVVVGDGPDRELLEAYRIDNLLDDHLRLLGAVPADRVRDLLRASEIFFLPSAREGIALSIFEAMACGVPIVAANVGGQAELVDPATGILVDRGPEPEEVDAYADAIRTLVGDPDGREAMGAAGRERIGTNFTIGSMNDRFDDAINVARSRHADNPRPAVPVGTATSMATLAIDYHRQPFGVEAMNEATAQAVPETVRSPVSRLGSRSIGQRTYAILMAVLGGPYRRIKRSNPALVARMRSRARRLLGYRR